LIGTDITGRDILLTATTDAGGVYQFTALQPGSYTVNVTSQPSDFAMGGFLTGSLGGSATVLAGSGNTYFIVGGSSLNIPGNVISDPKGNRGSLVSFASGNLNGPTPSNTDANGLEKTTLLRGTRALILENINGFTQNGFMRSSPSLMNVKFTAPYGLSGEFADLQSFAARHPEHFTGVPSRVPAWISACQQRRSWMRWRPSKQSPCRPTKTSTRRIGSIVFLPTTPSVRGAIVFLPQRSVCHGRQRPLAK
jgi:hypothetical protein